MNTIDKIKNGNLIDAVHLEDTEKRVKRAFDEMLSGYDFTIDMKKFESKSDDIVVKSGIPISFLCPHHLLPVIGTAYFGYIPNGWICGISKIIRLINGMSKVAIIQEEIGDYILNEFDKQLNPKGSILLIDATHSCEVVRGVSEKTITTSVCAHGCFREKDLEMKFLNLIRR